MSSSSELSPSVRFVSFSVSPSEFSSVFVISVIFLFPFIVLSIFSWLCEYMW